MKHLSFLFAVFLLLSYSCTKKQLFEKNIATESVEIIGPLDDSQHIDSSVTLSWEQNPEIPTYRIQIATPNFSVPDKLIVLDTIITGDSYTKDFPENDYQWRVRAENTTFISPYKTRFFSVIPDNDFYKNKVILLSPDNNITVNNSSIVFTWEPVDGTVIYRVQLINSDNNVIVEGKVSEPTFTLSDFKPGEYTWKVRADNDIVTTPYSTRKIIVVN